MKHTQIASGKLLAFPDRFGVPIPAVTRILSQFPPEQLACFIEVAIELLDLASPLTDNDPDFRSLSDGMPGEPSDHEPAGDDEAGAYAEWHTKAAALRRSGQEVGPLGSGQEDDEQDDPAEEDDGDSAIDDGPCDGQFEDLEEEASAHPEYAIDQTAGPLPHDPGAGRAMMRPYLDRVRRTRCEEIVYTDPFTRARSVEYQLREPVGSYIDGGQ